MHNKNKGLDLPSPGTKRWVKSRKLAVVTAIQAGDLSEEEACRMYDLSAEELSSWFRLIKNHGPDGLRTTHLKRYRSKDIRDQNFHISENSPTHRV